MAIFIFGLIFGLALTPILDGFTSLVLSFFEMIKSYCALKIARSNQKIQECSVEPQHVIGFRVEDEEVEYDDEDDL